MVRWGGLLSPTPTSGNRNRNGGERASGQVKKEPERVVRRDKPQRERPEIAIEIATETSIGVQRSTDKPYKPSTDAQRPTERTAIGIGTVGRGASGQVKKEPERVVRRDKPYSNRKRGRWGPLNVHLAKST